MSLKICDLIANRTMDNSTPEIKQNDTDVGNYIVQLMNGYYLF